MVETECVDLKKIVLIGGLSILLQACNSLGTLSSNSLTQYTSAQDLIIKKNINQPNGTAKEYVYAWGAKNKQAEPHSLYPRKYLSNYCHDKAGSFSLLHKSTLHLVNDAKDRNILANNQNVKQGIGAYQCIQKNGQRWIVSIEPVSEVKSTQYADARAVRLQAEIMGAEEARRFYKNNAPSVNATKKSTVVTTTKNNVVKPVVKEPEDKKSEEKKEPVVAEPVKRTVQPALTAQQQQMQYYVAARRDLAKGENRATACNNAQRAYNYGKLHGANASNVYAESGVLLARCLTSVPAYNRQVPNAKAKATGILQNLSNNYNHAGAKHMLNQMK